MTQDDVMDIFEAPAKPQSAAEFLRLRPILERRRSTKFTRLPPTTKESLSKYRHVSDEALAQATAALQKHLESYLLYYNCYKVVNERLVDFVQMYGPQALQDAAVFDLFVHSFFDLIPDINNLAHQEELVHMLVRNDSDIKYQHPLFVYPLIEQAAAQQAQAQSQSSNYQLLDEMHRKQLHNSSHEVTQRLFDIINFQYLTWMAHEEVDPTTIPADDFSWLMPLNNDAADFGIDYLKDFLSRSGIKQFIEVQDLVTARELFEASFNLEEYVQELNRLNESAKFAKLGRQVSDSISRNAKKSSAKAKKASKGQRVKFEPFHNHSTTPVAFASMLNGGSLKATGFDDNKVDFAGARYDADHLAKQFASVISEQVVKKVADKQAQENGSSSKPTAQSVDAVVNTNTNTNTNINTKVASQLAAQDDVVATQAQTQESPSVTSQEVTAESTVATVETNATTLEANAPTAKAAQVTPESSDATVESLVAVAESSTLVTEANATSDNSASDVASANDDANLNLVIPDLEVTQVVDIDEADLANHSTVVSDDAVTVSEASDALATTAPDLVSSVVIDASNEQEVNGHEQVVSNYEQEVSHDATTALLDQVAQVGEADVAGVVTTEALTTDALTTLTPAAETDEVATSEALVASSLVTPTEQLESIDLEQSQVELAQVRENTQTTVTSEMQEVVGAVVQEVCEEPYNPETAQVADVVTSTDTNAVADVVTSTDTIAEADVVASTEVVDATNLVADATSSEALPQVTLASQDDASANQPVEQEDQEDQEDQSEPAEPAEPAEQSEQAILQEVDLEQAVFESTATEDEAQFVRLPLGKDASLVSLSELDETYRLFAYKKLILGGDYSQEMIGRRVDPDYDLRKISHAQFMELFAKTPREQVLADVALFLKLFEDVCGIDATSYQQLVSVGRRIADIRYNFFVESGYEVDDARYNDQSLITNHKIPYTRDGGLLHCFSEIFYSTYIYAAVFSDGNYDGNIVDYLPFELFYARVPEHEDVVYQNFAFVGAYERLKRAQQKATERLPEFADNRVHRGIKIVEAQLLKPGLEHLSAENFNDLVDLVSYHLANRFVGSNIEFDHNVTQLLDFILDGNDGTTMSPLEVVARTRTDEIVTFADAVREAFLQKLSKQADAILEHLNNGNFEVPPGFREADLRKQLELLASDPSYIKAMLDGVQSREQMARLFDVAEQFKDARSITELRRRYQQYLERKVDDPNSDQRALNDAEMMAKLAEFQAKAEGYTLKQGSYNFTYQTDSGEFVPVVGVNEAEGKILLLNGEEYDLAPPEDFLDPEQLQVLNEAAVEHEAFVRTQREIETAHNIIESVTGGELARLKAQADARAANKAILSQAQLTEEQQADLTAKVDALVKDVVSVADTVANDIVTELTHLIEEDQAKANHQESNQTQIDDLTKADDLTQADDQALVNLQTQVDDQTQVDGQTQVGQAQGDRVVTVVTSQEQTTASDEEALQDQVTSQEQATAASTTTESLMVDFDIPSVASLQEPYEDMVTVAELDIPELQVDTLSSEGSADQASAPQASADEPVAHGSGLATQPVTAATANSDVEEILPLNDLMVALDRSAELAVSQQPVDLATSVDVKQEVATTSELAQELPAQALQQAQLVTSAQEATTPTVTTPKSSVVYWGTPASNSSSVLKSPVASNTSVSSNLATAQATATQNTATQATAMPNPDAQSASTQTSDSSVKAGANDKLVDDELVAWFNNKFK